MVVVDRWLVNREEGGAGIIQNGGFERVKVNI